jgi:hypothetical protein
MAFDEALAGRIRKILARRKGVAEKKMFGCVGFLLAGNMCCGVWKEFLILRLGVEEGELALRDPRVQAFNITGRPMRSWVMVNPEGTADEEELTDWVGQAVKFVRTLPAKD